MPTNGFARLAYFLLRVVAGLLFMQAGGMKLLDWFGGMAAAGQPPIEVGSQVWIGGVLELVGGALVLIGLFTRPAAFILSGEMAVAYFQFHYKWATSTGWTWPAQNGGGEAVLFCFIFLLFAAQGGGMLSVDGLRRSGASKPAR